MDEVKIAAVPNIREEKLKALQDAGVTTVRSLADIGKALRERTGW
ncbi:hypothetical protein GCM10010982_23350 [Bowmanella pacifica]|uniref:Uncharacterized protein n=1 Tax=Bowmanella pacifica TaxID=502051 RepID=A0A917YYM7_9ALTE|nr:hypothetical protein GCM10010982_23350 [Bowmanella pacifica]